MRVPLTSGFTFMPEGEHVLKISEAEFKEEFGKVKLTFVNASGKKHFENYQLYDKDGNANDGAFSAFSSLARAALNDGDGELEDIDPADLKGKYIKGLITYREYTDKEGKNKKTTQKEPGTWWEEVDSAEIAAFEQEAGKASAANAARAPAEAKPAAKTAAVFDLNALLGR